MNNIIVKENERELIRLLSRIELTESDDEKVSELLKQQLDWQYIFSVTVKNKIHLLIFNHLQKYDIEDVAYNKYAKVMNDLLYANSVKNEIKYNALKEFYDAVKDKIKIVPVKGAFMIKEVYKDYAIRGTNDFDFLVSKDDVKKLDEELNKIGFVQGKYNSKTKEVDKFSAEKKMLYRMKMYNLLPYVKVVDNPALKTVMFDISHSLDFSLDKAPVEEMIQNADFSKDIPCLAPEHFFIHMCCHHYREASNASWIMIGNDLNLIKFCDVREFILHKMDDDTMERAIQFAKKHNLEKAVYFTMYLIREIYNDGYETDILNKLDIDDESFLYEYGENEYEEVKVRKKDFWTSLFSENNIDEIDTLPSFVSLDY